MNKMKNILILGVNSYVGFYLADRLHTTHNVFGFSRKEYPEIKGHLQLKDSLDIEVVKSFINENKIDIVINCICLGNVDQCEKDQDLALQVNLYHVKNLVELAKTFPFKLIHFSSNAVYCGEKPKYNENSNKEPKNFYGKVKSQADEFIKNNLTDFLLVRVMTLYGDRQVFHRNNPGAMIVEGLLSGKTLNLVDDVYGNLLFIDDLVNFIDFAINSNLVGEFNISGDDVVNRHELGVMACEVLGLPKTLVSRCSSDAFPSLTKRAPDTSFDNNKVKNISKIAITPMRVALKIMIERMNDGRNKN